MTDYNDGRWHGWNGGECPVHPESRIDAVTLNGATFFQRKPNSIWGWKEGHDNPIIAFRVVKAYREPREFWMVRHCVHTSLESAQGFLSELQTRNPGLNFGDIIHVREVTP